MIRELEIWQTADGKRFDDARKALEHIADAAREIIDARLATLSGRFSANDRFLIVMAIIPDAHAAQVITEQMGKWVKYE